MSDKKHRRLGLNLAPLPPLWQNARTSRGYMIAWCLFALDDDPARSTAQLMYHSRESAAACLEY